MQKRNLFPALSPDPSKYPIYSIFHHTNHASILWAGVANHWLCFHRRYAFSCLRLLTIWLISHCAPHPPLLVPPGTGPALSGPRPSQEAREEFWKDDTPILRRSSSTIQFLCAVLICTWTLCDRFWSHNIGSEGGPTSLVRVLLGPRALADEILVAALPGPRPLPRCRGPAASSPYPHLLPNIPAPLCLLCCSGPSCQNLNNYISNQLQYYYAQHPSQVVQLGPCLVLLSQGLQHLIEQLKSWLRLILIDSCCKSAA